MEWSFRALAPPPNIKGAMDKQMRAERDGRASMLEAEGQKTLAIPVAEGNREAQSAN
jgi:regulator of protease activity HflC (stomatin/prohibitin superfamily)